MMSATHAVGDRGGASGLVGERVCGDCLQAARMTASWRSCAARSTHHAQKLEQRTVDYERMGTHVRVPARPGRVLLSPGRRSGRRARTAFHRSTSSTCRGSQGLGARGVDGLSARELGGCEPAVTELRSKGEAEDMVGPFRSGAPDLPASFLVGDRREAPGRRPRDAGGSRVLPRDDRSPRPATGPSGRTTSPRPWWPWRSTRRPDPPIYDSRDAGPRRPGGPPHLSRAIVARQAFLLVFRAMDSAFS